MNEHVVSSGRDIQHATKRGRYTSWELIGGRTRGIRQEKRRGFMGTKRGVCRLENQFEGARKSSIVKVRYRLSKVQLVIQR